MWGKQPKGIKCCRGDCVHYSTPSDENPCRNCTCCYVSNAVCKSFNFQSSTMKEVEEHDTGRTPCKGRMAE